MRDLVSPRQDPFEHDRALNRRTLLRLAAAGAGLAGTGWAPGVAALPGDNPALHGARPQEGNPFGTPTTTGGIYTVVGSASPGYPHVFIPVAYYGTTAFFICKLVYTPLVFLDSEWNQMGPGLASSWEWSADGKQLTMQLQPGVKFHDGQEFTARDVAFTFQLMVRKETFPAVQDVTIFAGGLEYNERTTEEFGGVTVIDDYTVRFNLTATSSAFILNLSNTGILPAHAFPADALTSEGDIEQIAFFQEQPFGTGPFKVQSFDLNTNVTLEANPDYFKGAPILDGIVVRFGVASPAQIAGLDSGDIDGIFTLAFQDARTFEGNSQVTITSTFLMGNVEAMMVATEKPHMTVAVRQGLLTAIDTETFIDTVTYGYAAPCPSAIMWPPLFPNDSLPTYPYDPDRARQLLQEGGWESGRTLRVGDFSQQGSANSIVAAILNMWSEVGVEAEYVPLDPANQIDLMSAEDHTFDLLFEGGLAWQAYDPTANYGFFACDQPPNYSHFCNPEFDELINEAIRTIDPDRSKELWQRLQVILQTELPLMPLWLGPDIWVINQRMHGGILGRGPINDVQAELWWKE